MPAPASAACLTRRFYAWERRGRGQTLYAHPVRLEPPFRFADYDAAGEAPIVDDVRRATWLSTLFQGRARPALLPLTRPEPLPKPFTWPAPLAEFTLLVPPDVEVPPARSLAWLESLLSLGAPVAYEVIAQQERAEIRIACARSDAGLLARTLSGAVPEAALEAGAVPLRTLWAEATGRHTAHAEFCLAREFMLPLATGIEKSLALLGPLSAALTGLRGSGGLGVLQVLFEPARSPWAEAILDAVTTSDGRPFFADAPQLTKLAAEKVASPLFAAVLRVAAKSEQGAEALEVVRAALGVLSRLGAPDRNELSPLRREGFEGFERDLLSRTSHRTGMLLCSRELAGLVALPGDPALAPQLRRRAKHIPEGLTSARGVLLGESGEGRRAQAVRLLEDDRLRHVHIVGASGTGKSTLLVSLILQDIEAGRGVAVLDPHGDLADDVLARLPDERSGDVVVFDPADEDYVVGWNVLHASTEAERQVLASDLVGVFQRLSTSWGDQMTSVLSAAVLTFLSSPRGGTLADLRRFFVDKAFREAFVATVEDAHLASYWKHEYALLASRRPEAPILTRLDTLLRSPLVRGAVSATARPLDFRSLIDGKRVLIARLSQGAIGAENAALLGSLLVTKIHQAALARQDTPQSEREPFFLYVDEFHELATPSMGALFSGVRKYGLGLVVAHQDLFQLRGAVPEVERAVLANAHTRVCFRVGDEDARKLSIGFEGFEERDLANLATGEAICRVGRAHHSFALRTLTLPDLEASVAAERRARIVAHSRTQFATPRADLETVSVPGPDEAPATAAKAPHVRSAVGTAATPPPSPASGETAAPIGDFPGRAAAREETSRVEASRIEAPALPPVSLAPSTPGLGRGGRQHKYLQELIQRYAESCAWRAAVEKTLPEGLGAVDVALEKGGLTLACEISVTSTAEHELGNVQKCLAAGFSEVVVVSTDAKALKKTRALVTAALADADASRVFFMSPEELFARLASQNAPDEGSTQVIGAYKVRVKRSAPDPGEEPARRRALSEVLAQTVRRLQGGSGGS